MLLTFKPEEPKCRYSPWKRQEVDNKPYGVGLMHLIGLSQGEGMQNGTELDDRSFIKV